MRFGDLARSGPTRSTFNTVRRRFVDLARPAPTRPTIDSFRP